MAKQRSKMAAETASSDPASIDDLLASNLELAKKLDTLIHLQRMSIMGPERIFRFASNDAEIAMYLPLAERDFIQSRIIQSGNFYEIRMLEGLKSLGLIKPGEVIYDVGANIGNHSLYFASNFAPKKLVAVEPQNVALAILRRNLELNEVTDCEVVNCMIGSSLGTGEVTKHGGDNLGGTSFGENPVGSTPMRTLDDVVNGCSDGNVDFIKIDVEGMHLQVIDGAKSVLTSARPKIWIELRNFKGEFEEGVNALSEYGYVAAARLGPSDHVFMHKDAI